MKKLMLIIFIVIIVILSCLFLYSIIHPNIKLKNLEKQVSNIALPENIEKIAMKSGIGDSGGNGDYSTYRVVLVVKTQMSLDELIQEFENRNLTFLTHIPNSDTPICNITHCENKVFKSSRSFTLTFDELTETEDYTNYYFIEFVE